MTDSIREAQEYQSIGRLSPAAEQVLAGQHGFDGLAGRRPAPVDPIDQLQAHDTSFWNRRGNRQDLAAVDDTSYAADFFAPVDQAADIPPAAGYGRGGGSYDQMPAAATEPVPFGPLLGGSSW
jgi:hypothetical protein